MSCPTLSADQQNIRFREFDIITLCAMGQALVVVVNGDREDPLGVILTNHVVVENLADISWPGDAVARLDKRRLVLLTDDVHAEFDTFVADKDGRPSDQLPDLMLALATKRAVERIF